jgi:hypothetical protein
MLFHVEPWIRGAWDEDCFNRDVMTRVDKGISSIMRIFGPSEVSATAVHRGPGKGSPEPGPSATAACRVGGRAAEWFAWRP